MRHLHTGRKLGVSPHHRKALLRNLTIALIEKETIKTTPARAKETRWFAERIVTLAKRGDVSGRRHIIKLLGSTQTNVPGENRIRNAIERVYSELVPRFQTRPGGYTQILRLAPRRAGDNAEMCLLRYIPGEEKKTTGGGKKEKSPKKEATKKAAAADKAPKAEKKEKAPEDKPAKAKAAKKKDKEG